MLKRTKVFFIGSRERNGREQRRWCNGHAGAQQSRKPVLKAIEMTIITSEKFEFRSATGDLLAGRLELPAQPKAFAVFAHCFTCGKNAKAATRIGKALASLGIGVLRFDFTGLGNSEGDFANTSFTSNVQDLIAASESLAEKFSAPQLLIGHSLGGTAALMASNQLPSIRAVATIGSPATPQHLTHLLGSSIDEINATGQANVDIGGRKFPIRKEFVDDLNSPNWKQDLGKIRSAVLICHSPIDKIVGIDEARQIYEALSHPKSFLSLDGADHLLIDNSDSEYVATMLAAWGARYLDFDEPESTENAAEPESKPNLEDGELLVRELEGFTQQVLTAKHHLVADEPISVGGKDKGMNPYEYLLAAIGTCTSMTMRMYANHKGWPLSGISVRLRHHQIHAKDCSDCESESGKISVIGKSIQVSGDLSPEQVERLGEIADRCPVHRTIMSEKKIESEISLVNA